MRIREYTPADLEQVRRLHAGGGFEFPDPSHPLVVCKSCLVDMDDRVRMAAFARLHASAMLFVDGTFGTPEVRLEAIKALQSEMDGKARKLGLDIVTTQAEGRFADRLKEDLGWTRGFGQMFFREV